MAENENILTRLGKLFQNSIVLRKTPGGQIKVKDVDFTQTALTSNFIDRYKRDSGKKKNTSEEKTPSYLDGTISGDEDDDDVPHSNPSPPARPFMCVTWIMYLLHTVFSSLVSGSQSSSTMGSVNPKFRYLLNQEYITALVT